MIIFFTYNSNSTHSSLVPNSNIILVEPRVDMRLALIRCQKRNMFLLISTYLGLPVKDKY